MIVVEPLGGLTNRLRLIASAIWLKEKTADRLVVIWNENFELNCPYHLLFEVQDAFLVRNRRKTDGLIQSFNQTTGIKKFIIKATNKLLGINNCISEADFQQLVWPGKLDIYETTLRYRNLYVRACQEFGDNSSALKQFRPVPDLRRKIDDIVRDFGANTIGVHVRRTDHEMSISNSPIDIFIEKMREEVIKNAGTNFFLCTDDAQEEKILIKEFGDKIIVYKKEINRQSITGMQDAVVDLYCLSKTSKILGSYWSSFSETAAKMNDRPLITIRKNSV
jgi:hypothetical protein